MIMLTMSMILVIIINDRHYFVRCPLLTIAMHWGELYLTIENIYILQFEEDIYLFGQIFIIVLFPVRRPLPTIGENLGMNLDQKLVTTNPLLTNHPKICHP